MIFRFGVWPYSAQVKNRLKTAHKRSEKRFGIFVMALDGFDMVQMCAYCGAVTKSFFGICRISFVYFCREYIEINYF